MDRAHRSEQLHEREVVRAPQRAPAPSPRQALLAMQRGAGNRAAARLVQRKIGFEFEMTKLFSALATPVTPQEKARFAKQVELVGARKEISEDFTAVGDMQNRDYLGSGRLVDATGGERVGEGDLDAPEATRRGDPRPEWLGDSSQPYRLHALRKKDVIVRRPGFTLEADEGNATQGGELAGKAPSNTEFVTDAFEEDAQGRVQLTQALNELIAITDRVAYLVGKGRRIMHAGETAPNGGLIGKMLISNDAVFEGALQVTAGIDLARVGAMMQAMNADENESESASRARLLERHYLGNVIQGGPGSYGTTPRKVQEAINQVFEDDWEGVLPPEFGSKELEGLVSLISAYMRSASGTGIGYAKTIAVLMARTDFAQMFKLLPERAFLAEFPALLEACVEKTTKFDMGEDLFPHGIYNDPYRTQGSGNKQALAGLTRRRWVHGIVAGIDHLTAANFNKNPDLKLKHPNAPKPELESMGARGATLEDVGPNARAAPIFEVRSLGTIANAKYAKDSALWIFDFIAGLNARN